MTEFYWFIGWQHDTVKIGGTSPISITLFVRGRNEMPWYIDKDLRVVFKNFNKKIKELDDINRSYFYKIGVDEIVYDIKPYTQVNRMFKLENL